jgi:hypothetical protein
MSDNQCWITVHIVSNVQQLGVGMFVGEGIPDVSLLSACDIKDLGFPKLIEALVLSGYSCCSGLYHFILLNLTFIE